MSIHTSFGSTPETCSCTSTPNKQVNVFSTIYFDNAYLSNDCFCNGVSCFVVDEEPLLKTEKLVHLLSFDSVRVSVGTTHGQKFEPIFLVSGRAVHSFPLLLIYVFTIVPIVQISPYVIINCVIFLNGRCSLLRKSFKCLRLSTFLKHILLLP